MNLQDLWFVLVVVLLTGYVVLDGFDLGVGVLYPVLGKSDGERTALRHAIGPVWDGNEVWLLTAGGALFAAFPPVYATVFSGFYLAMMLVLFGLIFRAVAIEYRSRDAGWARLWDWAFFGGSLLPALLVGVAAGNLARGVALDADGEFSGTFFGLLNPYSLVVGVLGLVTFCLHGAGWAALKTDGPLQMRAARLRRGLLGLFVLLAGITTIWSAFAADDRFSGTVTSVLGWVFIILLLAAVVLAAAGNARRNDLRAFLGSGLAILSLMGIWAAGSFPDLVPSLEDPALSLTAQNSSSSDLTLQVMSIIALIGVPIVLAYTALIYRTFASRVHVAGVGEEEGGY
jgi:cytochrome d ubiquinol oxidase subunit II